MLGYKRKEISKAEVAEKKAGHWGKFSSSMGRVFINKIDEYIYRLMSKQ